eukprot:NODE_11209_length_558_cov_59.942529_g10927_i0.p1 GENE.NODE_11209_length_558_cov_59.942529_g10927_i0~~NODE_11209_length_558_cov_59.942529_g10927_i0.p1  ORF type:complete len:138 (+),score=14.19 NODE_11209_length_558_cov_59.942529_g10927_i0:62-415(+)
MSTKVEGAGQVTPDTDQFRQVTRCSTGASDSSQTTSFKSLTSASTHPADLRVEDAIQFHPPNDFPPELMNIINDGEQLWIDHCVQTPNAAHRVLHGSNNGPMPTSPSITVVVHDGQS